MLPSRCDTPDLRREAPAPPPIRHPLSPTPKKLYDSRETPMNTDLEGPMLRSLFALFLLATPALAQNAPVPAKDAAAKMTVPDGFKVTLFAGEPDVVQPIAFTFDDRGRLWVVENHSYPGWKGEGHDRVLILEDKDNDGKFDVKTVFLDNASNLSGINFGYGGIWLCSVPNLLFVPDKNGDDRPDGPAEVVLDGWDAKAQHNVFNSLTWGPDGWLYGCNGILSNSKVGAPGTPDAKRVSLNCGVWRYHPTRKTFEAVFHGSTNPWGLDFDETGQLFMTNCVIQHAWQAIPGGHSQRMFGQPMSPNLYGLLESPADHIHWNTSEAWSDIRSLGVTPTTDRAGGGHAHSGAMIYLGGNWPDAYRNRLFTCNIHGNRLNRDRLEPKGSGFVVKHEPDFLFANDPWFRGLAVQYGPDGGVYVADWSDTGECHNYVEVDRKNGRIFKVVYGDVKTKPIDLAKLSDRELVALHATSDNEWQVRHARRLLTERLATRPIETRVLRDLAFILHEDKDEVHRLRALWTLHLIRPGKGNDWTRLLTRLDNPPASVRAWVVCLDVDDKTPDAATLTKFADLAKTDPSPVVRLALASALQRIPIADRWPIAEALAAHAEDATDQNLPLMIWYGIEPMVQADPSRALNLAASAKIPLIRRYIARRYASLVP
jgi:putative membrane-bound dehydrogenase-like protein